MSCTLSPCLTKGRGEADTVGVEGSIPIFYEALDPEAMLQGTLELL